MECRIHTVSLMLVISSAIVIAGAGQPSARTQQPSRVGLVIDFGNGAIATRCVEFSEPEITGYQALKRSGLRVVADEVGGMGVTICDIGQTSGCPASNCFCKCQGTTCKYWSYYHLGDGSWRYSPLGASGHKVHDGDVEGWAWGEGSPSGGAQPPVIPFDQVCAFAGALTPTASSPTATFPPPTSTEQPAATAPPSRSSTSQPATSKTTRQSPIPWPLPSPTAQPTATPSPSSTPARAASSSASSSPTQTMQPASISSPSAGGVPSPTDEQQAVSNDEREPSVSFPVGYIVFSLILGGLLGWLVFISRIRK